MNLNLLKERIKESGIKKQEIAENLGISTRSLNRKLHGDTRLNTFDAIILCKILNIDCFCEKINIFLSLPLQK